MKVVHGPGPWTRSTVHRVVHGPGPQGWSMDLGPWGGPWTRSTGVVHGPGSMFCIRPQIGEIFSTLALILV